MDCPVCGRAYPCAHSRKQTSALADPAWHESETAASSSPDFDQSVQLLSPTQVQLRADQEHWRREVASRVQQHRARRRRRFDANASFEFDFPAETALAVAPTPPEAQPPNPSFEEQECTKPAAIPWAPEVSEGELATRKVIRFPRRAPLSSDLVDTLDFAETLQPAPRILDAPEPQQLELLPEFPDIHLDDEPEAEPLAAIDLPPQPASPPQRVFSAIVDAILLLVAESMLVTVFTELAGPIPPSRLALPYGLITCLAFWCLFQYVFLVFGRVTPGMRMAHVELYTFAGQPAPVRARRHRVWATILSAISVGVGFLWALVDQDTLGWHDRISETYLKSSSQQSAFSHQPDERYSGD